MRIVTALTLSGLLLCGCQQKRAIPQPAQAVQVQAVQPEADDTVDSRYSAVVLPETQVTVAFRFLAMCNRFCRCAARMEYCATWPRETG